MREQGILEQERRSEIRSRDEVLKTKDQASAMKVSGIVQ